MKHKSYSIDRLLRRGMTAAGIFLILMILVKAIGMVQWQKDAFPSSGKGKNKVAECLVNLWNYQYPAGKGSEQLKAGEQGQPETGNSIGELAAGWVSLIWKTNPIYRFRAREKEEQEIYQEMDPAYGTYQKTKEFYQEHQYLAYYGDEESHQESLEEPVQNVAVPVEKQEAAEAAPVGTAQSVQNQLPVIGTQYVKEQLADYDFLMRSFYIVHASTTARREEMNAEALLNMDLSVVKDNSQPQILIYHTHSQETYADYGPNNQEATVVGIGNYLTELLEAKGYQVLHHTGVYDLKNGALDRSKAYTYALDGITGVLQEHPSIQVVLDVHRDGVKEGLHLVSEVNGKQTAQIMFFNGMSQTPEGTIEYLQNPYKEENLAFSLQMQLDAAAHYPGFTRKIYLKGLRYNLHLRPRSALIEVGAQTNTYEEARNAMEPLAELLDRVLQGH